MQKDTLLDWIQLINTDGIGPVSFHNLLKKHKTAAEALNQFPEKKKIFSRHQAERELEKASRTGIRLITFNDNEYPPALKHLNDAPPILYARGQIDLLQYPMAIAVVGSRNATVSGRKIASRIAYDLTQNDVLIISGMARGIDSAAHKGALYAKEQHGPTIAVLGTGVDVPYPAENKDLYKKICSQGLLISEFPLGTNAQPQNFPRRNRIVSGLCSGILVVEASLNSGSLITARLGLEQGKDVFAVPGSPLDGRSVGCHKLIREGACLTETADDILETISFTQQCHINDYTKPDLLTIPLDKPQKNADIRKQNISTERLTILNLISDDGVDIDELIIKSKMNAQDAMMLITELELDGDVKRLGNRLFKK